MERLMYDSVGVVEVQYFTNALFVLDAMEKASEVRLLRAEKLLGGRMVSLFVCGDTAAVEASIARANEINERLPGKPVKVAWCIHNPHREIRKLLDHGA